MKTNDETTTLKNGASLCGRFCITPVSVLYIIAVIFSISIFFKNSESAVGQLIASSLIQLIILAMLIIGRKQVKLARWKFLIAIFTLEMVLMLLVRSRSHYAVMLYSEIIIFIVFFSVYSIPRIKFIAFLNSTYMVYLVASVMVWLGVVPNVFYDPVLKDEFYISFGFISYFILYGIEGSPAFIDSYSALVLVVNIFMNHCPSRRWFIAASIFGIIASFRLTPMIALLAVFMLYPIYKQSRYVAITTLLTVFAIFLLLLYVLLNSAYIVFGGEEIDIWVLAYAVTHGRSMVWLQQLDVLFTSYDLYDYIFGRYSIDLFGVQAMQVWGEEKDVIMSNPHNTYMLLFYRSPLLFVMFLIIFFIAVFRRYDKFTFPVLFVIFLSAFTNSSIISLGNPVFLMSVVYFLTEAYSMPKAKVVKCNERDKVNNLPRLLTHE